MARWKKGDMASVQLDKKDMLSLAQTYIAFRRCVCGRLKVSGYLCPHCDDEIGLNWGESEVKE